MSAHFNNKNTQKRTNFHGTFFFVVASVVCDRFTNLVSFGVNVNDITAFGCDMRLQCLFFFVWKMECQTEYCMHKGKTWICHKNMRKWSTFLWTILNKNIPLLRNHNVYTETGTQICSLFFEKKKYDNKLCALLTESNFPFSALEDANLQNF